MKLAKGASFRFAPITDGRVTGNYRPEADVVRQQVASVA